MKVTLFRNMKKEKNDPIVIIGVICMIISSVWSFTRVFYGLDLLDTFYFAANYLYSGEVNVFSPLSQGIFILITKIFGNYIIVSRIVNWFFALMTPVVLYLLIRTLNPKHKGEALILMSVAIVLMTNVNVNVFNSNSFTALSIVGIFVSMYLTSKGKSMWYIGIFAFLLFGLLTRFPNISLMPLVFILYALVANTYRDYLKMGICLLLVCVCFVLINSFVFHGISNYFERLSFALTTTTDTSVGANHSMLFLLSEYLHSFKDVVSNIKFLSLISILPLIAFIVSKKWTTYLLNLMFLAAQLLFVILKVHVISDVFNYFLIVYFYALICILSYLTLIIGIYRHNRALIGWSIIPVLLSLCSPAGSDSGLCLWGWSLFALIPFIVINFENTISKSSKNEVLILLASLIALTCVAFVYCREGAQVYAIVLLAAILISVWFLPYASKYAPSLTMLTSTKEKLGFPMSRVIMYVIAVSLTIYAKNNMSFEWVSPKQFTCQQTENELKHIKTSCLNCQFVDEVMAEYRACIESNYRVIFYGFNANVFNYLTGQGSIKGTDFSQNDSERNLSALEKTITNGTVIFLCPCSYMKHNYSLDDYPNAYKMLEYYGYEEDNKGIYSVFYPSQIDK